MWPLGFNRNDLIAWSIAVVAAVVGTWLAWASGARLGAAITLGAVLMVVVVVAAMLLDARGRAFPDDD